MFVKANQTLQVLHMCGAAPPSLFDNVGCCWTKSNFQISKPSRQKQISSYFSVLESRFLFTTNAETPLSPQL